jgi:hypothetical protein
MAVLDTLALNKAAIKRKRQRGKNFLAVTICTAAATVTCAALSSERQPMHTSEQTGQRWLNELLSGIISFWQYIHQLICNCRSSSTFSAYDGHGQTYI